DSRFAGPVRLPDAATTQQNLTTFYGKERPARRPKLVAGAQAWATLRSLRPFAIDPVRSNLPRANPCFFAASRAHCTPSGLIGPKETGSVTPSSPMSSVSAMQAYA